MRIALSALAIAALLSHQLIAADGFKLETGFTSLFNGKNLDGWKTSNGEALEGKTEAFKGRFKVTDDSIVIDPKIKGNAVINTVKEFGKDAHIKFEFKAGPGCNNDFYFRGLKFDITKAGVKNLKEGEWQTLEIISQGENVEFKSDGATQRTQKAKTDSSPLGVRAEFGPIELRRFRAK